MCHGLPMVFLKESVMTGNNIIWLEPWNSAHFPKIKRLLRQLTKDRKRIDAFSHIVLKSMFVDQKTYIATIWDKADTTLIGMGTMVINQTMLDRPSFIHDVVVGRKYRRKGYAESIIRALIKKAKEEKSTYIHLHSNPKRKAAHNLYRKAGFRRLDEKTIPLSLYLA